MLILLLIACFAFWYTADSAGSRYGLGSDSDGSAAARPVLWTAALHMALDNPLLGVGFGKFQELAPEYADRFDPEVLARQYGGDPLLHTLGRFDAHNDYLNVWVSFGTGALILYVVMLVHIGANFARVARRSRDRLLAGLALGSLAAIVAFAVTYIFHSRFETSMGLWILAGLSLALTKLVEREPEETNCGASALEKVEEAHA
jgi:O-antigen ligase